MDTGSRAPSGDAVDPSTTPIVSFVGPSGVGKTTLIERLVPALRASGLRVGTVKHAPHGFDVDRVGSDSWRHRAAGADLTILGGQRSAVVFSGPALEPAAEADHRARSDDADLAWLAGIVAAHTSGLDVVLVEGYAPICDRLVVVARTGVDAKVPAGGAQPWIEVSDAPPCPPYRLSFADLDELVERIAALGRDSAPPGSWRHENNG